MRKALKIRLSRAATFQSLSLLAICVYFAVMAVLATALRGSHWNWGSSITAMLLASMMIATSVLVLSQWARGWVKVKLAKHLFEHRYDYRTEWLRFTETLGRVGRDAPPLGERIIKAFADIVEAPGGLLLVSDGGNSVALAAEWNWPAATPSAEQLQSSEFWPRRRGARPDPRIRGASPRLGQRQGPLDRGPAMDAGRTPRLGRNPAGPP